MSNAVPNSRSLPEIVEAIDMTRAELRFQIERLKQTPTVDAEQADYFRRLILRYLRAQPALDLLYGYHKSRLERHASTGQREPLMSADPASVSDEGKSAAYVTDEEIWEKAVTESKDRPTLEGL